MQTVLPVADKTTIKNSIKINYPKVLIAESSVWTSTAELPFLFKAAGCSVDVFCQKKSWLIVNTYFDNWIECDPQKRNFEKKLIELIEEPDSNYNWIVLADDFFLHRINNYLVDADNDTLKKILPLTKPEHRDILGSKAGQARLCTNYNLPSPESQICNVGENTAVIVNIIPYPVLLKEDLSCGGAAIYLCRNDTEFYNNLKKVKLKTNLVIQQYIMGKLIFVEALFKNGKLILYNYSEKLKTLGNEFSISTTRRCYTNRAIEPELIKLGKCVGINGFASISYIYEPDTKAHYLIEVDLRTNSWLAYGKFSGADFSLAIKKFFNPELELPYYPVLSKEKAIDVAIFYMDFRRCLYQKDIKGFLKWVFNYKNYWSYIPFYDKRLIKIQFKKVIVAFGWTFIPLGVRSFFRKFFTYYFTAKALRNNKIG